MRKKKDLIDFLKWWYEIECDRQNKINISIGPIFIAQTAIIGVIVRVFELNFDYHLSNPILFLSLLSAFLFASISIFYSVRSYWGQRYKYFGDPEEASEFFHSNIQWIKYQTKNKQSAKHYLDKSYDEMRDMLTSCLKMNFDSNNEKSHFRFLSVFFLLFAICLTAGSYFGYSYYKL